MAADGFADAEVVALQALIVTVPGALTKPMKVIPGKEASLLGIPRLTVSPSAAPLAVMVNVEQLFARITPKSSEAVTEICFLIAFPPPN